MFDQSSHTKLVESNQSVGVNSIVNIISGKQRVTHSLVAIMLWSKVMMHIHHAHIRGINKWSQFQHIFYLLSNYWVRFQRVAIMRTFMASISVDKLKHTRLSSKVTICSRHHAHIHGINKWWQFSFTQVMHRWRVVSIS